MFREFFYTMVNRKSNNSFTIETLVTRYQNLASVTHKVTLEDNIDLSLDFPSDLPHAQIQEFIESDKSGIAIFHGQPGCGKSSYIKYLIKTNPSERFTVVSTDLILRSPEKVRDYMINNGKSRIYILEDCENLLRSRDSGNESGTVLSDILNFADVVNNAPVQDLDITIGTNEAKNVFRKDEVKIFEDNEALLANAKEKERNMFKIPKVI